VVIHIQWTSQSLHKIARHGVTPKEVDAVLQSRVYPRRTGHRITVIGRTDGRHLFVVLQPSIEALGFAEVVTARDATTPEKRLLARRGKGWL
jgi:uncharacterized DUF497 family protein